MSNWKQKLLTNWHIMRVMRLGIGIMMIGMGIQSRDLAIGLFSIFFLYQAVTDTGCCGAGACNTPMRRKPQGAADEVAEYEEIK